MRRALLALTGYRSGEIGTLTEGQWQSLDRLAAGHRLQPHLHGKLVRSEIEAEVPAVIAQGWQKAHRFNAIDQLVQRRALAQVAETLGERGIAVVALKGSALAWSVWPSPAERVMRDIDVLVPQPQASGAYRALRDAGWQAPQADGELLDRMAREETHLPPLLSPDGVTCEVHAHAWASAPLASVAMPLCDDDRMLARAVLDDTLGMLVPADEDMLVHLVVHCAVSHLFNVGPLGLIDIDYLVAGRQVDWDAFWQRAQSEGFARPAALVVALTDRWVRPGFQENAGCPIRADAALLDRTQDLLVQDPEARKDINAIAGLATGERGTRLKEAPLDQAEGSTGFRRLGRLAGRGASLAGTLLKKQNRSDGLATADLARWLSED
ncbi:nucleotidyltransferase domain-containing protein [Qipengyuania seohaensis]|uniref:nucleotidyltransferase domain-containing protein n=1 Tax=Qipengyuania seohaensis TaxID=266951 RepID=UPI000C2265E7|nr:nucleotidyltransferase family protein [Qipengyuania seohaensis]